MPPRLPISLQHALMQHSTPESRQLVLGLIQAKQPLTVQELYNLAQQRHAETQSSSASDAPVDNSEQPIIPSMRYLKRAVLPALQQMGRVEKVHTKQDLTEEERDALKAKMGTKSKRAATLPKHVELWQWQLKVKQPPQVVKEKPVFGKEVGVDADWSHLNRRRLRAREEKVRRDVQWLKQLARARQEDTVSA
ncbi:hypothetical protein BC628DRAFT_1525957 [Trametes gibbosa]|nr:hypothetical protein BC628DRAFT_1525957 [Trametes gibbosa]